MYSILNLEQLITLNGVPNAHGKFYVYKLGRTELADIWYDPNGETILPNPLDLDNLGMGIIYVSNLYDYTVVCCDPYNNELFSRDIFVNSMGEGGNSRLYEGLDPICVNNEKLVISAKKATLSVQDPLYFVEDSQSAVCIGLQESAYSGLPYIENSAIELDASSNISGISGHTFHSKTTESASIVTGGWETGSDGRITGYNGTGFSAGKVYNGISPVYVDNVNDQIGVSSKDFLANSPLYFTEYSNRVELSISGLPPTPGLMYESGFNYASGKITGYNNSGISAGKVYSGISPITVDNVNDTISVASATLGVQAPLFFAEDSESATVIGLNTAQIQVDIPESANWNETYSTVNNNSANWNSASDAVAGMNTAKWEEASNVLSSNSADWNNKLDADIYANDSGKFLTAVPADYATTAWVTGQGYLTAETDWTDTITAASANAYNQATALIPTALTGDYIETSAMKSAQLGTSAFVTGFYDGQISATFANEANKTISARNADSAGSARSASYAYSGWGLTPTLYHTDSAIKQYYAVTGSVQGFPAGTLYKFNAYSADSAAVAASAEKAERDSLGNIIAMTYLTANRPIPESANWNSTYDTVSNNSATWGQGGGSGVVIPYNDADPETMYNALVAAWDGSTPVYLSRTQNDTTYIVQVIDFYDGQGYMESYFEFASVQNYYDGEGKLRMIRGNVMYNPRYVSDNYSCFWTQSDIAAASYPTDSDTGKVLTVNNIGRPEWQTPQGGEFPQSATDAINVVTGGSANWNSTTATVSTNSGAWGGQGIEISAGFGIDIQLVDNKLLISLATATGGI